MKALSKSYCQVAILLFCFTGVLTGAGEEPESDLLHGHPRESYLGVKNIGAMEAALRDQMAGRERHSFSRSWWGWDRLRARYVDGGRKDAGAIRILRGVFRGHLLDRHRRLEKKGEGDLLYIFYTSLTGGRKEEELDVEGRTVRRDVHGGGYHGGWGGAARMRIYLELVREGMLTEEEQTRFEGIVRQSLERRFIDFTAKSQSADNHTFGNAGGIAIALNLYPDAPQAKEAREWIDRIWGRLADYGDWREWTYYPYGPIFLHGLIDIAEATGRIESEKELIQQLARRCLGFVHGGGVRGNPNAGSLRRKDLDRLYADPWNVGYYNVETSSRDGNFWYRLGQHYKDPEYLWAAEQVALGGRPPGGVVSPEYADAYERRFRWFVERDIKPKVPAGAAAIGLLSPGKLKRQERVYLTAGRGADKPFAAFFLYEDKAAHLDNLSGHLYEYSVDGIKYLHTSGKYNNVYSRDNQLVGGGVGEESLDLLLVMHDRNPFPLHPDRSGDQRDHMRRGALKLIPDFTRAENNPRGDSMATFAYNHYYGRGSRWERTSVLTREGYLVVADRYVGGADVGEGYLIGPVWHLGLDDQIKAGPRTEHWFSAPALDRAWWQSAERRLLALIHPGEGMKFGAVEQRHSQDTSKNMTTYAFRPLRTGIAERFLTVFVPYNAEWEAGQVAGHVKTTIGEEGQFDATVGVVRVVIRPDGQWTVTRPPFVKLGWEE